MKKFLTLLLLIPSICFWSCGGKSVFPPQDCTNERNDARYWEKSRWMRFNNDSVRRKALDVFLKNVTGQIDDNKAVHELMDIIMKSDEPFNNTKQY